MKQLTESFNEFGIPFNYGESTLDEDFKTAKTKFTGQGGENAEVDQYLSTFKQMKQKIKDVNQKDIDKWGSWPEFKAFVDQLKNTKTKNQEKKEKKSGAKLVIEDKYWKVYHITTKDASILYGAGTKWCITQKDQSFFEDYVADGNDFYFYISKRLGPSSPYYKICLQIGNNGDHTYWDATDKAHGENEGPYGRGRKLGKIPFSLPEIPGDHLEAVAQEKLDDEPLTSIYLVPGSVFTPEQLRDLADERISNVPQPGVPTGEHEYINVASTDSLLIRNIIAIIGQDKIKEVAPEVA